MKVEIYTGNYFKEGEGEQPRKLIFKGWLDSIPRCGESVRLNDDWCSQLVIFVTYNLLENSVDITIDPDYTEEYNCLSEKYESLLRMDEE